MSLDRDLALFSAELESGDIPQEVRERARACLVHGLVVGAASVQTGFGGIAEAAAGPPLSSGGARSLVSGERYAAQVAAHINGTLLQARAQEDTHGTFHSGVVVLPAALAAAEVANGDGKTLLDGVIIGYEVGIALSRRYTELSTPPHRATGVYGPVAAAAAAARIMGLDVDRTAAALAIAAAHSGGTTESFGAGTHEWHFQSGLAAGSGVIAANLAAAGALGSDAAFEGPGGFLEAYPGTTEGAGEVASSLGSSWGILEVTFKPFPVCAFNQTPALIASRLHADDQVDVSKVESVRIEMNEREARYPGMDNQGPYEAIEETLMSTQFSVATALVGGEITFASLGRFDGDPQCRIAAATELVPLADREPKTAAIELKMSDGQIIRSSIEQPQPEFSWDAQGVRQNALRLRDETHLDEASLLQLLDSIGHCDEIDASKIIDDFKPAETGWKETD